VREAYDRLVPPPAPAPPRLTRWEVVGGWLRIWTPPRGAVLPPVPWLTVLVAVGLLAVAGVVIAGEVEQGREAAQAREGRARAERARVRRAAQAREQRAIARRLPAGAPALPAVESAITREAQARHAAGELDRRATGTRCRLVLGADPTGPRVPYECLAATSTIVRSDGRPPGTLGYPFRAVVEAEEGRVTFCATNPIPGERVVPDPDAIVRLPVACRLPDEDGTG
jgi:hypothetical protein